MSHWPWPNIGNFVECFVEKNKHQHCIRNCSCGLSPNISKFSTYYIWIRYIRAPDTKDSGNISLFQYRLSSSSTSLTY